MRIYRISHYSRFARDVLLVVYPCGRLDSICKPACHAPPECAPTERWLVRHVQQRGISIPDLGGCSVRITGRLDSICVLACHAPPECAPRERWPGRYVHTDFAGLEVAGLVTLQAALFGLVAARVTGIIRAGRNGLNDHNGRGNRNSQIGSV